MGTTTTHTAGNEGATHPASTATSEAAIIDRIVHPEHPSFSPEAARGILALDFDQADKERMHVLSAKAREGTLTADEQAAVNNYERVGHFLNILQSKARRSLKSSNGTGAGTAH